MGKMDQKLSNGNRQKCDTLRERLERFWEKEAPLYAKRTIPALDPYRLEYAQHILACRPETILEVGCNAGMNLVAMRSLNKEVELHGCDVAHFEIPLEHRITFTQASVYNLPYPDKRFTVAFTLGLLEHIPPDRIEEAVKELVRVAQKWVVIREDTEVTGDGSYRGEPNAIFIHPYKELFLRHSTQGFYSNHEYKGYRRITASFYVFHYVSKQAHAKLT